MEIKLYYMHRSRAIRPRWLLEELQLPYSLHPINVLGGEGNTPEYKKIHPLGQVPALEVDGQLLIESGAMCHWLADMNLHHELAPSLADPVRAKYEQWMYFVPGTLEPPAWTLLLHGALLPTEQRVSAIMPFAQTQYNSALAVVNAALQGRDYILGEKFSTADIMLASTLNWLPDALSTYPILQQYLQRIQQRSAFQRAAARPTESA